MTNEYRPSPSYDPQISKWFFLLSLILPLTLILALLLYREPFHFLHNAFSELGDTVTSAGTANYVSRLIFSAGWIVCGILMLQVGRGFAKDRRIRGSLLKQWLAWAGGVGFFVAITPNDVNHLLHSVGMGMVVGVTYAFGALFLFELRRQISATAFVFNMLLLQSTVLTYAVMFFFDSALKQAAQKLCVIGLLVAVEKASTMAPEGFEWRAALHAIRSK